MYNKKKFCKLTITIFIVLFLVVCIFIEIKREIPRNRPNVSIKYNKTNISTTLGEHNWATVTLTGLQIGNSYLAGSSYDVGKETSSFQANPSEELEINFSSAPKEMKINIWKASEESVKDTLNFPSEKVYKVSLPSEKGEYIFEVIGHWSNLNNTSHIFRTFIE